MDCGPWALMRVPRWVSLPCGSVVRRGCWWLPLGMANVVKSIVFGCAVGVVLALGACGSGGGGGGAAAPAAGGGGGTAVPTTPPDAVYVTRAQIVSLPVAGQPGSAFRAHHEAVDDFKDRAGKVVGMNAMVMEFPPAAGLNLSGFKVGDIVLLEWKVWWSLDGWLATKVTKLPPETKLIFGKADPSKAKGQ